MMKRWSYIFKEIASYVLMIVVVFGVVKLTNTYIAAQVKVDGRSMDYSLQDGQRLIVSKFSEPERFDIVVVPAPEDPERLYVKRLVGMPGDELLFIGDRLIINGVETVEPYLAQKQGETVGNFTRDFTLVEATGSVVVPEGMIFVLGDNRQNSLDSRDFGFLPLDDVFGVAKFSVWPFSTFGKLPDYDLDGTGHIQEH